jgi:hypothetical protein
LIPSWFRFFNKHHEYIGQKQLRDAFFKPYPLYQPGVIDMYLLGMINDNVQKRDTFITSEVTEHLFESGPSAHGVDLAAINVQRGRDHGTYISLFILFILINFELLFLNIFSHCLITDFLIYKKEFIFLDFFFGFFLDFLKIF